LERREGVELPDLGLAAQVRHGLVPVEPDVLELVLGHQLDPAASCPLMLATFLRPTKKRPERCSHHFGKRSRPRCLGPPTWTAPARVIARSLPRRQARGAVRAAIRARAALESGDFSREEARAMGMIESEDRATSDPEARKAVLQQMEEEGVDYIL